MSYTTNRSCTHSSHSEEIPSEEPMLTFAPKTGSYNMRLQNLARRGKCKWIAFVLLTVLVLLLLLCGAVIILFTSDGKYVVAQEPDEAMGAESQAAPLKKEEKTYKFEYQTEGKQKEQVIINVKDNYTELFADDVTVFNHFKQRISLHRIQVTKTVQVCLVKTIKDEVKPKMLENALSELTTIQVNSSELYVIDSAPVPEEVLGDMTVHQFCSHLPVYLLKQVNVTGNGPDIGLTIEDIVQQFQESGYIPRKRRQALDPYDQHNGGPYYCGGPIGTGDPLPAIQYTCTKKKNYCYRSLVNEQCDECYHGHYLRSSGCWCPINAIQTCIKITYRPDKRYCCGTNLSPCIASECDTQRVPFLPIPKIQFSIIKN